MDERIVTEMPMDKGMPITFGFDLYAPGGENRNKLWDGGRLLVTALSELIA